MPTVDTTMALFTFYLALFALGSLLALRLAFWSSGLRTPLGLVALASGLTCFGGAGLLTISLFTLRGRLSLLAASVFSLLSTVLLLVLAAWVWRITLRRQQLLTLTGTLASVSDPITPGRFGRVVLARPALPITLIASSSADRVLPSGTTVVIIGPCPKAEGTAVAVAPLALDGEER